MKKAIVIISSILIIIILFFTVVGVGIYKFQWHNSFTNKMTQWFPYPAATVSFHIIRYTDWQNRIKQYQANKNIYLAETDIDMKSLNLPDDQKIAEKALQDLITEAIISQQAKKNKLKVSNSEIDQAYHDLILSKIKNGELAAEKTLQDIYGLSISEFKEQIIKNYLLRQKLTDYYAQQPNSELKTITHQAAEDVLNKINAGEDFDKLAREYSDDGSALNGGDIGYIGHGVMLPFYDQIAWQTQPGQVSGLIQTPDNYQTPGYYIIKVEDKRDNNGEEEIKIRQIFIETNLDRLLEKDATGASVRQWVKII